MVGVTFWDLAVNLLPVWLAKALLYWCVLVMVLGPAFGLWACGTYLARRNREN